jgi:hypothetical protein
MNDTPSPEPGPGDDRDGISRRGFMVGSLAAGGALALTNLGSPASAAVRSGARRASAAAGRRVAVFGGGMAGLSAAHELAERGFQVTVYERKAWGGKARSIPVAGTGSDGRQDLPGEHGFRFFPGFYQNLPDTMSRIPVPGGGTAFQNLVAAAEETAFYNGKSFGAPISRDIGSILTPRHSWPSSSLRSG